MKFLGIFSNNMDEFFRVRVATLKRMAEIGGKKKLNMHLEQAPEKILEEIQMIVLEQQSEFNRIWDKILIELKGKNIPVNEKQLNKEQQNLFSIISRDEVRANIIPDD
jgi:polyphosphate kinase